MSKRTYAAQLVFTESDAGGRWTGRLLTRRDVYEHVRRFGTDEGLRPLGHTPRAVITEHSNGRYELVTQGAHRSGRRYSQFASCTEAQEAALRWAARKYRVIPGGLESVA